MMRLDCIAMAVLDSSLNASIAQIMTLPTGKCIRRQGPVDFLPK
jgi:hypothetical protein